MSKEFPGHNRKRQKKESSSKSPGVGVPPGGADPVGKKEVTGMGEAQRQMEGKGMRRETSSSLLTFPSCEGSFIIRASGTLFPPLLLLPWGWGRGRSSDLLSILGRTCGHFDSDPHLVSLLVTFLPPLDPSVRGDLSPQVFLRTG